MKNLIQIIALIILFPLMGTAQNQAISKLFHKYKNAQGFELEIESSDINFNLDSDNDFTDFLNGVELFSILKFEKEKGSTSSLNTFNAKLNNLISKQGFERMIDIQSEGSFSLLTRKGKSGKPTDYLLIIDGDQEAHFILASAGGKAK
jgi:hypothetical protein